MPADLSYEELLARFHELQEKHARLSELARTQSHENVLVARLSRWVLHSRAFAVVLLHNGVVTGSNSSWRALAEGLWRSSLDPERPQTLLDLAIAASRDDDAVATLDAVRAADGNRVRIHLERIGEPGNESTVTMAIESRSTQHRARNHLAAATLQAHLLLKTTGANPEAKKRAESIADLIQRAAAALDDEPQRPR